MIKAMDLYRQHFPQNTLIFLFISDDPQWAKEKLLPRIKTKGMNKIVFTRNVLTFFLDFFLTGTQADPDFNLYMDALNERQSSAGLDLALLASCNHTITSYGSYSFWTSFLARKGLYIYKQIYDECYIY